MSLTADDLSRPSGSAIATKSSTLLSYIRHNDPRFVEGIEIIKKLWTEDDVSFEGKEFS